MFIVLPLSIIVAHGLKYVLEKWYSLFPENPYARIFALLPLSILLSLIIIPGLLQYIYGYHYNPNISSEFTSDLAIIRENLTDETLLLAPDSLEYNFYKILENRTNIKVVDSAEYITEGSAVAIYKKTMPAPENLPLFSIITSEKSDNSDIIYLYKTEQGE